MQEHWSAEKYSEYMNKKGESNKYRNKTCWYDGLYFQSQKELNDYLNHKRLLMAGQIAGFLWQGTLVLVEGGSTASEKAITYRPDIITFNNDGTYEFREDKGRRTKDYIIKEKLIKRRFPKLNFREV